VHEALGVQFLKMELALRIYWPGTLGPLVESCSAGIIYGWINDAQQAGEGGATCVVAGLIPCADARLAEALGVLESLHCWEAAPSLATSCAGLPVIIGQWGTASVSAVQSRRSGARRWLVMTQSDAAPQLPVCSSWSTDPTSVGRAVPHVVIVFDPPQLLSLRYFSSRPCRPPPLHALGAKSLPMLRRTSPPAAGPERERAERERDVAARQSFDVALNQLNATDFVNRFVRDRAFRGHSSDSIRQSIRLGPASVGPSQALRLALWPPLAILLCFRVAAAAMMWLLTAPILPGGLSLYVFSVLAQQVHLKCSAYCAWPALFHTLKRRRRDVLDGR
jgi:hypothetical protein